MVEQKNTWVDPMFDAPEFASFLHKKKSGCKVCGMNICTCGNQTSGCKVCKMNICVCRKNVCLQIRFPGGDWIEWTDNGTNRHQLIAFNQFVASGQQSAYIEVPHAESGMFKANFVFRDNLVQYTRQDGTVVAMKVM